MQVSQGYDTTYFRSHKSYVFLGLETFYPPKSRRQNPLTRDTLIYINSVNPGQIYVNTTRIHNFDGTDPEEITRGTKESMKQIMQIIKLLNEEVPGFENCYISSIIPTLVSVKLAAS